MHERSRQCACVVLFLTALAIPVYVLPAEDERAAADKVFGVDAKRKDAPAVAPVPAAPEQSEEAMDKRLRELTKSVETMEARLGRPQQPATAAYNIERRLKDIERRLELVEKESKRLDGRVRRLEQKK
ncbi:MAG: hypothetical protein PHR35_19630 [Kiritimatiellae bacterium]|nr:hypothetical protein [Kiritimatiellia bacterium]